MNQYPAYKSRGNNRRGIQGRRQRRRAHRRDFPPSQYYEPMQVDPNTATKGVQTRLFWALISVLTTVSCIVLAMTALVSPLELTLVAGVGMCAFSSAVALLLSARREEMMHEVANELSDDRAMSKVTMPRLLTDGQDGTIHDLITPEVGATRYLREPVYPDGMP